MLLPARTVDGLKGCTGIMKKVKSDEEFQVFVDKHLQTQNICFAVYFITFCVK